MFALRAQSPEFSPEPHEVCVVEYTRSPSTVEVELGGSEVQGRFWLCNEFQASLGYMRPF